MLSLPSYCKHCKLSGSITSRKHAPKLHLRVQIWLKCGLTKLYLSNETYLFS